ncbi:MAG: site-specific integrase [Chloroflexota bacterium]
MPNILISPFSASHIRSFDDATTSTIAEMLKAQHVRLAQVDRLPKDRTLTARNYDSAIKALGLYMVTQGVVLPTKSLLGDWRDSLLQSGAVVSTVNARLSAARKLLRGVADDVTDITVKTVLNDWATVSDARKTVLVDEDKTESDYGRRFTLEAVEKLIHAADISHLKGLRDRAMMAVMVGAGLRVSEVANLTLRDLFLTQNEQGQRGVKVRQGKHKKSRVVILSGWNSWVIQAVQVYTDAVGLTLLEHADEQVFRGVKIEQRKIKGTISRQGAAYTSAGEKITSRNIEAAVNSYTAHWQGQMVHVTCHDLRRTYAKICKQSGMSWEALRANMGHSSVTITEKYVGLDVDWSERVPNWTIQLD